MDFHAVIHYVHHDLGIDRESSMVLCTAENADLARIFDEYDDLLAVLLMREHFPLVFLREHGFVSVGMYSNPEDIVVSKVCTRIGSASERNGLPCLTWTDLKKAFQ